MPSEPLLAPQARRGGKTDGREDPQKRKGKVERENKVRENWSGKGEWGKMDCEEGMEKGGFRRGVGERGSGKWDRDKVEWEGVIGKWGSVRENQLREKVEWEGGKKEWIGGMRKGGLGRGVARWEGD